MRVSRRRFRCFGLSELLSSRCCRPCNCSKGGRLPRSTSRQRTRERSGVQPQSGSGGREHGKLESKRTAATPTHVIELGQASLDLGLLAEYSSLAKGGEECERCDDDGETHAGA